MKGDFTRDTFNPAKHFSRVLLQQGRVLIDADWNEQASILLHHLRTLTEDLLGPHAGPAGAFGFEIWPISGKPDFYIGGGHYYVEGILSENPDGPATDPTKPPLPPPLPTWTTYTRQPDWQPRPPLDTSKPYFVYLDVWERLITAVEDPDLRETALGQADTAARAKVVWQVKVADLSQPKSDGSARAWPDVLADLRNPNRGKLLAFAKQPDTNKDPCVIPPTSQYRGENQLWRIEVHKGGDVDKATFKVSYDNGSVVFPVVEPVELVATKRSGKSDSDPPPQYRIRLAHLGKDERTTLTEGDWVELVDDNYALQIPREDVLVWEPDGLLQVVHVDSDDKVVTVSGWTGVDGTGTGTLLRRWDHRNTEQTTQPGTNDDHTPYGTFAMQDKDFPLVDGIHLAFERKDPLPTAGKKDDNGVTQIYRPGDYWLIPGREATGDIEWPKDQSGQPRYVSPRGVAHHYAPLALLTGTPTGFSPPQSLRSMFPQNETQPTPPDPDDPSIGVEEL